MKDMTESELHAIMTGGFATIAGSVFGIYVFFGVDPVAILAASVMSAPAALAISKITFPETEESPTAIGKRGAYDIPKSDDSNIVHAATSGAVIGTQLMLNIAGNLSTLLLLSAARMELTLVFGTSYQSLSWPCSRCWMSFSCTWVTEWTSNSALPSFASTFSILLLG